MKLFSCQGCGQLLYFENVRCENCGRLLGYLTDLTEISALEPQAGRRLGRCWRRPARPTNSATTTMPGCAIGWSRPTTRTGFCAACRHNRVIPDLSVPGNDVLWRKIETAKHRLFYSLLRLGLPLENRADDPEHGLAFDFLADPPESHAAGVMTGHDNGLITLALKEADDAMREKVRSEMGEPYRTLLGHFRHEIGHYFWDRLVADRCQAGWKPFAPCSATTAHDYDQALQKHYDEGAPPNWQDNYRQHVCHHPSLGGFRRDLGALSAHRRYAGDGGRLRPEGEAAARRAAHWRRRSILIPTGPDMERLIDAWLPIEFATNSMNRSMGQTDLYPFLLSPKVIEKLGFIHALTHARRTPRKPASAGGQGAAPDAARERGGVGDPPAVAPSRRCPCRPGFPG